MSSPNSLTGKTVLIAGGNSGMGLAVAKKVMEQGGMVHLVGRSIEKLQSAFDQISSLGKVSIHALDISDENAVVALAESIDALDHLVTTAADLTFKPLADLTRDEIARMVDSKVWGPVLLTKYLAPKIDAAGSIVYFSGVAADKGGEGAAIVGAVNGALHGLAKNLVYELSPVRVNVVSPGVVQTPTWSFMSDLDQKGFYEGVASSLPARRVGQPDDLAEAAVYLMTNKYTNGTILTVDGGANA